MKRVFSGWERPALVSAAEILLERAKGDRLDLGRCIVALPGSRAGRRLLEILVERSEERGLDLTPPRIITLGHLPELLFDSDRDAASELTQTMVWAESLERCSVETKHALLPDVPAEADFGTWMGYAEVFLALQRDLAGELCSMRDVARSCEELDRPADAQRWNLLANIQDEYRGALNRIACDDPQLLRMEKAKSRACRVEGDIYLIGAVDMGATLRAMLQQVDERVTALVFAPESLQSKFDDLGCMRASSWKGAIDLRDDAIRICDRPQDQAAAAIQAIAELDASRSADEIVIGNADTEIAPHLLQVFNECDLPLHDAAGLAMENSGPLRLLDSVADYLESPSYEQFASLIRHPDLERRIAGETNTDDEIRRSPAESWLAAVDKFAEKYLPGMTAHVERLVRDGAGEKVVRLVKWIEEWLTPLVKERLPFNSWAEPIRGVLLKIYDHQSAGTDGDTHRETLEIFDRIADRLREIRSLRTEKPRAVGPDDAIRWLSRSLAGTPIPQPTTSDAIELLGWLELTLDDAPIAIVTGFNEGNVPRSIVADPFLPDGLRKHLGMADNERRYARDAYALTCLAATRQLKVILGKRSARSDPLTPSRLLLACTREELAPRVVQLFTSSADPVPHFGRRAAGVEMLNFPVPSPQPLEKPLEAMSVTAFRDYLACPFGFYLRHIKKLRLASDASRELDPLAFGNLAHAVLEAFGNCSESTSRDARDIFKFLGNSLDSNARLHYGDSPRPAVRLQLEQLRLRLRAFANWQAKWAGEGWRILHSESVVDEDDGAVIRTENAVMKLKGRIDRIDVNESTGKFMVFDYKTSENVKPPKKVHQKKGEWIDLQLPLYRHLVRTLEIDADPDLAYILLPGSAKDVGHHVATWNEEELESADERARWVVDQVHEQVYGPPAQKIPMSFKDFATIYQENILTASDTGDGDGFGDGEAYPA